MNDTTNPTDLDCCSVCGKPAHASETDDLDRCESCRVSAMLAEVKRHAGDVRVERDEDAPLLWSVWCVECEDIIGTGHTEEEALNDALDTIVGWAKDGAA